MKTIVLGLMVVVCLQMTGMADSFNGTAQMYRNMLNREDTLIENGMTDKMVKVLLGGSPDRVIYDDDEKTMCHAEYDVYYNHYGTTTQITAGSVSSEKYSMGLRKATATVYYSWDAEKKSWLVYKVQGRISDVKRFNRNGREPIDTPLPLGELVRE